MTVAQRFAADQARLTASLKPPAARKARVRPAAKPGST